MGLQSLDKIIKAELLNEKKHRQLTKLVVSYSQKMKCEAAFVPISSVVKIRKNQTILNNLAPVTAQRTSRPGLLGDEHGVGLSRLAVAAGVGLAGVFGGLLAL